MVLERLSDTGKKPRAFIHWVTNPLPCQVRLYQKLFKAEDISSNTNYISVINPGSLRVVDNALVDRSVQRAQPLDVWQFERLGYFCVDSDSTRDRLVFNRTVTLKEDSHNPIPISTAV